MLRAISNLCRWRGRSRNAAPDEEAGMGTELPLDSQHPDEEREELPADKTGAPETPVVSQQPVQAKPARLSETNMRPPASPRRPQAFMGQSIEIQGRPAVSLPPYRGTYKPSLQESEDRIYTGLLAERYPVIIVADGASTSMSGGHEVSGYGGEAAELAVQMSREYLEKAVQSLKRKRKSKEEPTLAGILNVLRHIYSVTAKAIRKQEISGSTTLLIAVLVKIDGGAYWVYSHLGDGWMTLLNPSRQINNWLIPSFLVSPGHRLPGGSTATLPDLSFPPVVGAVVHQPGDVLVVASDGIDVVEKTLFAQTRIDLGNTLWRENFARYPGSTPSHLRIPNIETVRLSDDLSIGAIWTGGDHERNRSVGRNRFAW